MNVLIDHNLSPRIAHALAAMAAPHGHKVEAMTDKFGPARPDVEWLGLLGQEGGWTFISNDQRIWRTRKSAQRCSQLR